MTHTPNFAGAGSVWTAPVSTYPVLHNLPAGCNHSLLVLELLVLTVLLAGAVYGAHRSPARWSFPENGNGGGFALVILLPGIFLMAGCVIPLLILWIQSLFGFGSLSDKSFDDFFYLFSLADSGADRFPGSDHELTCAFTWYAYLTVTYLAFRLSRLIALLMVGGFGLAIVGGVLLVVGVLAFELFRAIF